jgi:scyllo-inositol 2-dehydrogenase (NADP+)
MPDTVTHAPLRTAIIGYGLSGAVFHAPFIEANSDFQLSAIITSDPKRQEQAKADHREARIYQSFDELMADGRELDLVILATPPDTHLELGLRSIAAGAGLVVDKPFVATAAEGRQLEAAAREAGRPLMVFQNRRWDGDFLTVRNLVESGRLGQVFHFESNFEHWSPRASTGWKDQLSPRLGGGVAYDLGSHLVDQALVLFGRPASIQSRLRTVRAGGGNDDHSEIHITHESGVVSRLLMSRIGHGLGPRFRVLGTEGAYTSEGLDPQEPALASGMSPADERFGVTPESGFGTLAHESAAGTERVRVRMERGDYSEFYRRAAAALRETGAEPIPTSEALDVVAVLEEAYQIGW